MTRQVTAPAAMTLAVLTSSLRKQKTTPCQSRAVQPVRHSRLIYELEWCADIASLGHREICGHVVLLGGDSLMVHHDPEGTENDNK